MMKRILTSVSAAALLATLTVTGTAQASSAACQALGATCGSNVDQATGLGWVPKGGTASLNNPVNAYPNGNGNATDWLRTQPVSSSYYRYEYAPQGVSSGYCASDPGSPDGIVLRTCNTMNWQEFRPANGGLTDVATGLKVQDNGQSNQLTGTTTAPTQWSWAGGSSGGGGMTAPPGYTTKILDDTFTGTSLDSSKWVTYVGDQGTVWNDHGYLPLPYSGFNQPGATGQAMYSPSQLSVNNGLSITAQRNTGQYSSTYPWVSGTINSEGKFTLPTNSAWFVQARIQVPDTSQGMWPSMWFLCGSSCSTEHELDGLEGGFDELPGVPANRTVHYDYHSAQGSQASEQDIGTDISAGYHVYGVEFKPGVSITWYFDGVQKFQVLASQGVTIDPEPYEIMLNLQVAASSTSGYHTVPNSNTPPSVMRVSEVQAYTP
jgi:hypothetical protein